MDIERFEEMLQRGQDSALLRFTLGQAYLRNDDPEAAARHLEQAVAQDRAYSAAWKLYGQALARAGDGERAREVYEEGIAVAEKKGDKQAAKEMTVFLKRLQKKQM